MSLPTSLSARAAYKKQQGVLTFAQTNLTWSADGSSVPAVRIGHSDVNNLLSSKEGAPQIKLKVLVSGPQHAKAEGGGYQFVFTSPPAQATKDRDAFKNALSTILSQNRAGGTSGTATPTRNGPVLPASANGNARAPLPSRPPGGGPALPTRATSTVGDANGGHSRSGSTFGGSPAPSIAPGAGLSADDIRLRKKVLVANPDLMGLHRDLVMSGQITEAEFWEGREFLLHAQLTFDAQQKGRPGQIVDPRPELVDGDIKIVITPQLVHDIFEEYPVVARAYAETVPDPLTEAEFWSRYFQSRLFNAHRASIRSAATQHVVRDDPIFDAYLEREDDEIEPRRQRNGETVHKYIDLGATREDHGETGNDQDVTMQAGRQRATLPLIRKFNEHSERLLRAALGDEAQQPPTKKRRTDTVDAMELDLDDLHDPTQNAGLSLDMQDRSRYFEGQAQSDTQSSSLLDTKDARTRVIADASGDWTYALGALKFDKKGAEHALREMTETVAARHDSQIRQHDIPDSLLRQMTTAQTAANEFLRQFWLAVYPSATDLPPALPSGTPSTGPAAQKAEKAAKEAKAARMAGFLARTPEKMDALVREARRTGVDYAKVEVAMKPTMEAVNHALAFQSARAGATNGRR